MFEHRIDMDLNFYNSESIKSVKIPQTIIGGEFCTDHGKCCAVGFLCRKAGIPKEDVQSLSAADIGDTKIDLFDDKTKPPVKTVTLKQFLNKRFGKTLKIHSLRDLISRNDGAAPKKRRQILKDILVNSGIEVE